MTRKIEAHEGSENIFADIGLKNADELFARAQFHRFSKGKLMGFLKKPDREVILVINQPEHRHGISLSL